MSKITLATAKKAVRALGFSLTKTDGEYRLAPTEGTPARKEAQAHYTNDIEDALGTALVEFKRRSAT
jgi:hypothetical protein